MKLHDPDRIIERKVLFLWLHWLPMCRMRMKGEGMEYHTTMSTKVDKAGGGVGGQVSQPLDRH